MDIHDPTARIRDAGSDGQVLERGRRYGDLAAAGAVEERAQADECDCESRPRGESVQQTGNAALKAKLLHNKRGKPHAEQRTGQAVAAGGVIRQRAPDAVILLKVAVPVYHAADRHGEDNCKLYRLNHHWFNSYRFSFSTNGISYNTDKVQSFIQKNLTHLSIGITIDGTKRKHDLNRIWKGSGPERGSYEDVVKNISLWLEQFPGASTKVTISSADIPYIKESVMHLYSLGIHEVNINCVFEDVWREGDDVLFENQLMELADDIIDGGYYQNYACSFFTEMIGKPLDCKIDNQNWCGAGRMLSIDAAGNFYPCTRFAQYSLRNKKAWIIGNIHDGIDKNKLRPFLALDRCTQSTQECIDCEVASGCAWCQGENYDAADTPTIYQRSTAICKMHKARVRANNYYWNKLFRKIELEGNNNEE